MAPVPLVAREWAPVVAGLCTILALQVGLIFTKSVNWDEFFFFSMVQQLHFGLLTNPLQTFPTRIFAFLGLLPLDSLDQLLAGRAVMFGCELVTLGAIFGIARRFCRDRAAALCSLTYLSAGYVFLHGFAFRADPLATALLMSALWCVTTRRLEWPTVALISLLVGLAGVVTIKAIFYAPAFAGAAWLRWTESTRKSEPVIGRISAIAAGSALVFAVLFLAHRSGLPATEAHGSRAGSAFHTVFSAGLFPQAKYLWQQILLAPHVAMMIVAAPLYWMRLEKSERVAMAGLLLPVFTVVFYRNAYPYYFVFVLAPVLVTAGPLIERIVQHIRPWPYVALLAAEALVLNMSEPRQVLENQRSLVDGVHRIFPRPVAYFDASGMVGDFPRPLSILVSGWGLQSYRNGAQPSFVKLASERPVPLLILDDWTFDAGVRGTVSREILLAADARMIRQNYLPHWGMVWVAGKRVPKGSGTSHVTIAVPGTYTVEGAGIAVDGRRLRVGDRVQLARGQHVFTANARSDATLRWGDRLAVPAETPPRLDGLFTEY
jgi:hypothetical protein